MTAAVRVLGRIFALAVVAVGLLFIPASGASAVPVPPIPGLPPVPGLPGVDCKDAPTPEAPGRGVTGLFTSPPKTMPTGPSWENGQPVFEHYGYAGYRWNTYDLGCAAAARTPDAVVGTAVANWTNEAPKFIVAGTGAMIGAAYHPTFLQVFDPLVVNATAALRRVLFDQWVPVFVALTGLLLMWRARKMQMSAAMPMVVWTLVVFFACTAVFSYPLEAGKVVDQTVTSTLGVVNRGINGSGPSADPADEVKQNLTAAVLFEQWKQGQFGASDSPAAQKYAQPMWESQALTWAEAKTIADDPDGAGKRLLSAKAKQYENTAEAIKKEDPDAYAYLTGRKSETRISAAVTGLFAAAVACPLLLVSSLLILACFLLIRFAVILLPAIATIGISYQFRGMLKGLANVVMAAVINCIAFGVIGSIGILSVGELLSSSSALPRWLALVLLGLTMFILWVVARPFRRLTQMTSASRNVFGDAAGSVGDAGRKGSKHLFRWASRAGSAYVGSALAGARLANKAEKKRQAEAERVEAQPTVEVAPETAPTTTEPLAIGTGPAERATGPFERPAGQTRDRAALDAAPVPEKSISTRPAHTETGPFERPAAPERANPNALPAAPSFPAVSDGTVGSTPATQQAAPATPDDTSKPARTVAKTENQTGNQVWRPGDAPLTEDDIPKAVAVEPEVTDDGKQVWVVWRPSEDRAGGQQ
jgi:hypothetical protein